MGSPSWWHPDQMLARRGFLEKRARMMRALRAFFERRDFLEVETPALQTAPGMEAHVHGFSTMLQGVQGGETRAWLHTSPEFAMKKLLVAGLPRIFQTCHVYRNGEGSRLHSPEFTMLEWYRAGEDYSVVMRDCVALLRACATACGRAIFDYGGHVSDPFADWQFISVAEAFRRYAGIDVMAHLDDVTGFRAAAGGLGLHTAPDDAWDDVFFRIFLEKIEPELGHPAPTILYEYPAHMAALSRVKADDARVAERFEVYVCGMELANAFGELTDAGEQRRRFEAEMALKQRLYGDTWPVDEDFIAALEFGMPEASGIAMGVDRLAMLCAGAEHIDQVLWAPVDVQDLPAAT